MTTRLNLTSMEGNLIGLNSRNHKGVSAQFDDKTFQDTLQRSHPKINKSINTHHTPSRAQRSIGNALTSMETPSTVFTTPKQTPLTTRGGKYLDQTKSTNNKHRSIKTINDQAARNIL